MGTLIDKDTSGIYEVGMDEAEIVEQRTRNFKKFSKSNALPGQKSYRVAGQIGPIHYHLDPFSATEQYKEIDLDIVLTPDDNWDAACETNGYQVRFWQSRKIKGKTFRYIAQFRRGNKWLGMAPIAILWRNAVGEKELISKIQAVGTPVIDNDNHQVTWQNAFGAGIDFRYNLRPDEFFKTLVINNKSDLPSPTIGTEGLRLILIMALAWHQDSKASNDFANSITPDEFEDVSDMDDFDEEIDNPGKFSFKDEALRDTWWLRKPRAWDSFELTEEQPNVNEIALDWKLRRKQNYIFALLSVTASILNKSEVIYPVFIDDAIAEEQVGASTDDAKNFGTTHPGDGNYSATFKFGWLGSYDWAGTDFYWINGFRFQTVPIPQGVTIDNAWMSFHAHASFSYDCDVNVVAEGADSAAAFASGTHEPYDAYVARGTVDRWDIGVTAWTTGTWYGGDGETSENDIAAIVQEITDRGGWAEDNNLVLVIYSVDYGDMPEGNDYHRGIHTWDEDGNASGAKFNCNYTEGAATLSISVSECIDLEEKLK